MKKLLIKFLNCFGFSIVKINSFRNNYRLLGLNEKLTSDEVIDHLIKPNTMINNYRIMNIQNVIKYIVLSNIKGDFVECGVWKGGACAMMAYTLKRIVAQRTIHLFDSFDDIVEPDAIVDGERAVKEVGGIHMATGKLKPIKGIYSKFGGPGNESHVLDLISNKIGYPSEKIKIHKGLFQDTLPLNTIESISFLRLDGDWYSSTRICLEYLYPKVTYGGIIVIDDYSAYEGCKKAVDEYLVSNQIFPFIQWIDEECICWVKI